jgi:aspartate carbamoyltransferase catalytic subunit
MHSFEGNDFLSLKGVDKTDLEFIFDVAKDMEKIILRRTRTNLLADKILGSMFFQASTRTRISFESAMQRLGGGVVGFSDPTMTRAGDYYGESLEDTTRMMEHYADILVIRHPHDGAPAEAANVCGTPVINAGDGYNEHPTQALLDLYTILREKGHLEQLSVAIVGDMNIRGIHSLCYGLSQFQSQVYFVSPKNQSMHPDWITEFKRVGLNYEEHETLDDILKLVDVIYLVMTKGSDFRSAHVDRTEERIETDPAYVIDCKKLANARHDVIVLHPLPRLSELPTDVDSMASARYFVQPYYGVAVRMALLAMIFGRVD